MGTRSYLKLGAILISILSVFLFPGKSSSLAQSVSDFTNLGLLGGQIYDIAIDPSDPDKIFAGSYLGDGLFKSTNGGNSWEAVVTNGTDAEQEFKNHAVRAVKIAPSDHNVIWASNSYWVEKSEDGGQTWTHIRMSTMQGSQRRLCQAIAIDLSDSQIVYVGTAGPDNTYSSGAIYKTVDGGTTWTKLNGGNNFDYTVQDISIDPQNNNIIWAVTSSYGIGGWGGTLYRSNDGGNTWSIIFSLTPSSAFLSVAVKPNDSNIVFTGSGFGIIKHYFNDNQWKYSWPVISESRLAEDLVFDPQNANTLYATWLTPTGWAGDGVGKVARSTDGGNTWEIYPHNYDFISLAVHPENSEIIFAGERNTGVYKSTDHGQTWTSIKNGIHAVIVYDVAIDPNDSKHILAGTISGIYEKKGSATWSQLTESSTRSLRFHPTNSQIFYAGIEGYLSKTLDGGLTWTKSNLLGNGYNYVSDIAIDPTNTNTIFISVNGYGNSGSVYKSTNEGDIFNKVLDGVNQSGQNYPFNAVAIDNSNNQHIFAGGGSFYAPKINGDLWESTDGGNNWKRTSLTNVIVNALLINPENHNIMYAGTGYSGGTDVPLYKSTDGGVSWTASSDGIPGYPEPWNAVTDLEFHRQNKNIIYASTNLKGIYVSDSAKKWLHLGTPFYDVYAIATSSLYAATNQGLSQLTGTGIIAGKIMNSATHSGIDNARVFNDLGIRTVTVDGSYIMVSPPGICSVTAVADNHSNMTEVNVPVSGGDVTFVNFSMVSGIADTSVLPGPADEYSSGGNGAGGGKACFIATAAYGSPMSQQVQILRNFRDRYLLPSTIGSAFIDFYYRNGKYAANYIEMHSWLKPPVRLILYPLIVFAWLMLYTTTSVKIFIGLSLFMGLALAARKFNLKGYEK